LQSPNSQNAKIRILLNALRVVHGRLTMTVGAPKRGLTLLRDSYSQKQP
jgi:hypothetical protein